MNNVIQIPRNAAPLKVSLLLEGAALPYRWALYRFARSGGELVPRLVQQGESGAWVELPDLTSGTMHLTWSVIALNFDEHPVSTALRAVVTAQRPEPRIVDGPAASWTVTNPGRRCHFNVLLQETA